MIEFPDKKYNIIYADPLWDYGNTKNHKGKFWGIADRHYSVLKIEEIISLPIKDIADKNCYLFIWVTSPFIEKVFKIIKSWSFKYSTIAFVWIKMKNDMSAIRKDGLGKYTISNAEYCLIARSGKYWRKARNIHQIIQEPKTTHSKKPDIVRDKIVELCGDLPRIELFARERVKGWDVWGDEV